MVRIFYFISFPFGIIEKTQDSFFTWGFAPVSANMGFSSCGDEIVKTVYQNVSKFLPVVWHVSRMCCILFSEDRTTHAFDIIFSLKPGEIVDRD